MPASAHVSRPSPAASTYLKQLGENIRLVRTRRSMSIRELAIKSGLSQRFVADVERGRGNISVARLHRISRVLDVPMETLATEELPASPAFEQSAAFLKKLPTAQLRDAHKVLLERFASADASARRSRIALIGLRGAGKSTLGSLLAHSIGVPFIELDKQVERDSGLTLGIIFDLHGPSGYLRMEREALDRVIASEPRFVLATGGGIVSDPAAFNRLLSACYTIYLRAKPEDHMARVLRQGDRRPIRQSRQAMRDLRRILWSREALYRQADAVLETSGHTIRQSLEALIQLAQKPG